MFKVITVYSPGSDWLYCLGADEFFIFIPSAESREGPWAEMMIRKPRAEQLWKLKNYWFV